MWMEMLRRVYAEATPPLDIDEAIKSGYTQQDNPLWCNNHKIKQERAEQIMREVMKENRCPKRYTSTFLFGALNNFPSYAE